MSFKLFQSIFFPKINNSFRVLFIRRCFYNEYTRQIYHTKRLLYFKTKLNSCNINVKIVERLSRYSSTTNNKIEIDFELACNETIESLCEYFDHIIEESPHFNNADITFSDGVLTVQLGEPYGTYVINRHLPNKQIWLSSPISGPKRYDFNGSKWIYKHDGISLHELLNTEISKTVSIDINFFNCVFSGKNND